ncbi:Alpha/Beta hydrolase protein [Echria macrotheca]|uniref:Alpha/Beta hydrolase protein n=1 Tax=Echria macrotheca TaxID=438768 RepID=A0AAJ0F9S5_9PEZI|nr:Alpha/Beta hydrolase protein [Echria macrotheca]
MEKLPLLPRGTTPRRSRVNWLVGSILIAGTFALAVLLQWKLGFHASTCEAPGIRAAVHDSFVSPPRTKILQESPYGVFPKADDAFRLLPCTNKTVPPALNDTNADRTWAGFYDPDPSHWSWGPRPAGANSTANSTVGDPYAGRGIYLCGYLEVPMDYTNKSDSRIMRLAITKYQVSGLARSYATQNSTAGGKSERTIVIEPGGPGGSGTGYVWSSGYNISQRLSGGQFDILGWDPRGVNISRPAVECFTHDAERDRWYLATSQHRAASASPRAQLEIADAMNEAIFRACFERHGDLGRFLTTAFVARDLEEIRKALGEDDLTGYLVSYGTGIGQTYAGMFPDKVGRMILDGTEYVRDHRHRGGFGWTALDNATDAWRDGFLGECLNAGPARCALAKPRDGNPVTLADLMTRMDTLITSLIERPIPATVKNSPTMIMHSYIVDSIYSAMYSAKRWPALAQLLYDLESGNATLAATRFQSGAWWYDPSLPCPELGEPGSDSELGSLVVCSDSYDAPEPDDVDWWLSLWANMTTQSWIAGNGRWYTVLPCRHFNQFWPKPAEVFRGDLNQTLRTPVMLIAEVYDPATPLRNGRRLAAEMGSNARMIVHHGYGHSSVDTSNCTDSAAKAYILNGTIPEKAETDCYANEKPYLYGVPKNTTTTAVPGVVKSAMLPGSLGEVSEEFSEFGFMAWKKYPGDMLEG